MNATLPRSLPLLAGGFRPFFLLAGAYGVLSIAYWVLAYRGTIPTIDAYGPIVWHGHEMLFGFALAAASGFLLTVIPAWTGTPPVAGARLAALVGLWVLGRAAFWFAGVLPPIIIAAVDVAFPAVLAACAAIRLVRARQRRNAAFPILLAVLTVADACVHAEALGWTTDTATLGLHLALHVFVLMIVVIGGRIIPMFTANVLAARGETARPVKTGPLEIMCVIGVITVAIVDLTGLNGTMAGWASALTAAALALRAAGWRGDRALNLPFLWILHLGHAWLPIAYALKAASELGIDAVTPDAFVHAITAGAMSTAILGVMTRASLGHTGRPLKPGKAVDAGYFLIAFAATIRVFGPMIAPSYAIEAIVLSGIVWTVPFAVFTIVYAPILAAPRADRRPG